MSPYAAPARSTDLANLPAAFAHVGQCDLVRDEVIAYAQRLMQAGAPTELHVYPGAFHGFTSLAADAALSRRATDDLVAALRKAL